MTSRAPELERTRGDWFRFDIVPEDDYHGALAERRRHEPVQVLTPRQGDVAVYAVYRHGDVARVLRDQATFTLDVVRERYSAVLGSRTMLSLGSDGRRPYRKLLGAILGPGRVPDLMAGAVVPVLEDLLDDLPTQHPVDLVDAVSARLPVLAMTRMLGLSADLAPRLGELSAAIAGFMDRPIQGVRAARDLRHVLREAVADRRRCPRSDLISEVVWADGDPALWHESDVLSLLTLLVWAGTETTGPALSNVLLALLLHPCQLRRVRADASLLPGAIAEGLRWQAPMQWTCRSVALDTEVRGTPIPAGSLVLAHIGSANRDETRYRDAARFDVGRSAADHFAFGHGPHHCVGSHLGRAELRLALSALLDRFPEMELADEPPSVTGQVVRSPKELPVLLGPRSG
ncbi:MAG TPA: cytochrome P450 [Acidimicrobiales bacterium]|nr:cytochrome P450 [Acidimicrobiales bacterium]